MKLSLRAKITCLFLVVFLFVCILFSVCISLVLDSNYRAQSDYQQGVMKALLEADAENRDINVSLYLLNRGFSVIDDVGLIANTLYKGEVVEKMDTKFGIFTSLGYKHDFYLRHQKGSESTLFSSKKDYIFFEVLLFGFLLSLLAAFALYLYIIKHLNLLERLRKQVISTKNGNFSARGYDKDEIGEIATEFSGTVHKMRELVESRQLFLRTIMHEFKTPIGKGRLVAEMMKEKKQKERLVDIFTRLDALINESAKIESLFSKNYALEIKPLRFEDVLERAKELLLDNEFDKKVKVKKKGKYTLNADLDGFALVLKNLIENALKYSDDTQCVIECFAGGFAVRNKGKAFKQDFAEYLKPFTREKGNAKEGMGLGLYIVDKICQSHDFELHYEYKGSNHCFKVITDRELNEKDDKKAQNKKAKEDDKNEKK